MARGVNTRLTSARSRSCRGGSIMIRLSKSGRLPLVSVARSTPYSLLNARQFLCASTTSSQRDSAANPYVSFR